MLTKNELTREMFHRFYQTCLVWLWCMLRLSPDIIEKKVSIYQIGKWKKLWTKKNSWLLLLMSNGISFFIWLCFHESSVSCLHTVAWKEQMFFTQAHHVILSNLDFFVILHSLPIPSLWRLLRYHRSQPFSSIFLCFPLPSGTWWTPGLSFTWCCFPD